MDVTKWLLDHTHSAEDALNEAFIGSVAAGHIAIVNFLLARTWSTTQDLCMSEYTCGMLLQSASQGGLLTA